jgi:outer membrane protein OmpA-like peptidoglycan-associated protein/uncharacterized protein YidB (DUF937 family)
MALLDEIVRETGENFGLGNRAGPLVAEAIRIMFDPKSGGLHGLFDRFDQVGLGELPRSWRNNAVAIKPLDGKDLESVIGAGAISEAGKNLGMANARVKTAMAYVIPRLSRFFTSDDIVPTNIPMAAQAFLNGDVSKLVTPAGKPVGRVQEKRSNTFLWWSVGVLSLLVTAAVLGYQVWKNQSKIKQIVAHPREIIADKTLAPSIPEPEPGKPVARLTIRNDGGQYEYTGVVTDAGMKANITEQLLTFYGQSRLNGNLMVDPSVGVPGWLSKLDRVLPQLNIPGVDIRLEGNTLKLGGWLSNEDRESVLNSLKTALGPGFRLGYLGDEDTELAQESHLQTLVALSALPPNYQGNDLAVVLNRWVIRFPEGSSVFPEESRVIVNRVVDLAKKLAVPVVFEIGGHTDNQGNDLANLRLSLERANSMRIALTAAGLPDNMLQVKGYGSQQPVASNETPYGRFKNRRIEFRVVQVCDEKNPCGFPQPLVVEPPSQPLVPVVPLGSGSTSETVQTGPLANPDLVDGSVSNSSKKLKTQGKPKSKPRISESTTAVSSGWESSRSTSSDPVSVDPTKRKKTIGGASTGGSDAGADKPAKSRAPSGGRWIPQISKTPAPPKTPEVKKPAVPTKSAPAPSAKPKLAPKPAERHPSSGASDLF